MTTSQETRINLIMGGGAVHPEEAFFGVADAEEWLHRTVWGASRHARDGAPSVSIRVDRRPPE